MVLRERFAYPLTRSKVQRVRTIEGDAMAKSFMPRWWTLCVVTLFSCFATPLLAGPFPPYWKTNGGAQGTAVHYMPVAWPSTPQWIAYTRNDGTVNDPRTLDP